jgi:hypothetical protein
MIHKHFKTKAKFSEELAKSPSGISDSDICFIKDTGEIWTHGKIYAGSDALAGRILALENVGATKTEASETNGNIKINGTETKVYTHPVTTATTAAAVKVGNDTAGHVVLGGAITASDIGAIELTLKGVANGVAELDSSGKVPQSQLPSYVDDVLEYDKNSDFPVSGETGKIYVNKTENTSWRWSGSTYVQIKGDLALGETSSTAYYGDKGKIAYDHSQTPHAIIDATKVEASSINGNIKIDGTETTVYTLPDEDPYTSARIPLSHSHGNITNGGALTDTAAAATGNDYLVIRDSDNNKIQTSNIKGVDVADAVTKKHSHSSLTLSLEAQKYDGNKTLQLPAVDPYDTARPPASHSHGNISNGGTLTDTADAATGNDYLVIRDADSNKIQTSTIKGVDVADAVTKKHTHSSLTLSKTAQAYDGDKTLQLPASDPYDTARTPTSHTHGNITNSGTIASTEVTAATGVIVYDSNNKIQRATAEQTRSIIGAGTSSLTLGTTSTTALRGDTKYAASASAGGDAINSDKIDGYHVLVVTEMPASPSADTIYIVK